MVEEGTDIMTAREDKLSESEDLIWKAFVAGSCALGAIICIVLAILFGGHK